jgi:hypothetical protein
MDVLGQGIISKERFLVQLFIFVYGVVPCCSSNVTGSQNLIPKVFFFYFYKR